MAKNTSTRGRLRLLAEGLVVLVSILAAFLLEGWRDDREFERETQLELINVRRELERNYDLILAELSALQRVNGASAVLIEMLERSDGRGVTMVPDTLAWLASVWSPTLDASLGAVDALIASGRLAQIDDPDLRLGLAGLKYRLEDALEEELVARQIGLRDLVPLIRGDTDFNRLAVITTEFFGGGEEGAGTQEVVARRPVPSFGDVAYPTSAAVRNTLAFRQMWFDVGVAEYSRLLPHFESLIGMVNRETE